jgi:hypothetical protein
VARRAADDVETAVHAVDTVHVGATGRVEHRRGPRAASEPGVGGAILGTGVGLDLDDPADSPAGRALAHQAGAQEAPGGLDDPTLEKPGEVLRRRQR